jgi:beta-lactamase superfamily II metal-dependent hydrolase
LANHRVNHLHAVIGTHLDVDHIGGLMELLQTHFNEGGTVGALYLSADRSAPRRVSEALLALIKRVGAWEKTPPCQGFTVETTARTNRGPVEVARGADWRVQLVLPFQGAHNEAVVAASGKPNRASAVVRVTRGDKALLIGGDAPLGSWERLPPELLRADMIRAPHHGGNITEEAHNWRDTSDLYDSVGASQAILSVGTNNGHGHPLPEHVEAARRRGVCGVRCTQLTSRCHADPQSRRTEALRLAAGVEWPYRHLDRPQNPHGARTGEVPCFGSMVTWIDARHTITHFPDPDGAHLGLLGGLASPMCRPDLV